MGDKTIKVTYKNNYDDVMEALTLLAGWAEGKAKTVNLVIIGAIAVVYIILFARNPGNLVYFMVAFLVIFALICVYYMPLYRRQKIARETHKLNGTYVVTFNGDGFVTSGREGQINVHSDKTARAVESDRLYVIRLENFYTFCIPKRCLSQDEDQFIHDFLVQNIRKYRLAQNN